MGLQGHMSLSLKAIIINLISYLKFIKEYHITLSILFFSLWYQITRKNQLEISILPYIKFSCIKQVSCILLKWHPATFKEFTVHICTMFESQLLQVCQKLTLYTVELNSTQLHSCPELKSNKLFQVIQLLRSLKYNKVVNAANFSSFKDSAMIHSSYTEVWDNSGSMWVLGRFISISNITTESAGLVENFLVLNNWYNTITLLSFMFWQILLYLLQVFLILNTTVQSFFITFLVLSFLNSKSYYGRNFYISLFFRFFYIILEYYFIFREFFKFGHCLYILSGSLGFKITEILYLGATLLKKLCHLRCTSCFPFSPPLIFLQKHKMQEFLVFSVGRSHALVPPLLLQYNIPRLL